MLADPRRLLVLLLLVAAATVAVVASTAPGMRASMQRLAAWGEPEPYRVDVDAFSARSVVTGDAMVEFNEALLERDAVLAIRGLAGDGRVAPPPTALASLRGARGAAAVHPALDGIPRRELRLEAFVDPPFEPLDPWTVEVQVDVRPVAGEAPEFASPRGSVTLQLRPWGDAASSVTRRWQVERVTIERAGLLGLARDVVYVRRGDVGVLAPTADHATAVEVADIASGMQADVRRRYRALGGARAAFVALVPTRRHLPRVYDKGAMPGDAIGTAYDGTRMAILLPEYERDPSFVRRDLIRHELTHLATARMMFTAPTLYVEGLAEWEGNHEIVAAGSYYISNGDVVSRLEAGRLDLDAALFERDAFDDLAEDDGYRLGMLVADYLETEHGHARALRFYGLLGEGVEARVAVRRALRMSPGAFRDAVRSWAVANRSWFG